MTWPLPEQQTAAQPRRPATVEEEEAFRHWFTWELDCGDAAGLALQALRLGVPRIRIDAGAAVDGKLADIAGRRNAIVVSNDPAATGQASAALDLAGCTDAGAACRRWLGGKVGKYCGKDEEAAERPVAKHRRNIYVSLG